MEDDSGSDDGLPYMDPRLHKVLVPPPSFPSEDPNPLPGSILLEPHGYISDRTNSTTADGFTRDGKPIRVTFWVSDPPRASFFTVYIHEAGRSAIGNLPTILNTEEDIVLLRIPIPHPPSRRQLARDKLASYAAAPAT
nr:unnamed protein product [Digitaria exilis]